MTLIEALKQAKSDDTFIIRTVFDAVVSYTKYAVVRVSDDGKRSVSTCWFSQEDLEADDWEIVECTPSSMKMIR